MTVNKSIIEFLRIGDFKFLITLNLISTLVYLIGCRSCTVNEVIGVLSISFTVSFFECLIISLIGNKIGKILYGIFRGLTVVLILIESYCLWQFGKTLSQDIIDIILETNTTETKDFLNTYCNLKSLLFIVFVIVCLVVGCKIGEKIFSHRSMVIVSIVLALIGLGYWICMGYGFVRYRNGYSIPQYNIFTRVGYSYYVASSRQNDNKALINAFENCEAALKENNQPANVLVVIGESYNKYHSSLYGYEKKTTPIMDSLENIGSLVKYSDYLTPVDHTQHAMERLFTMGRNSDLKSDVLFPMVFKKAGYRTEFHSNQYFVNKNVSFLSEEALSKNMYDVRNDHGYGSDLELINNIVLSDSVTLYIVQLMGQHYTYKNRYPKKFDIFKYSDYKAEDKSKAEILAAYDNATLFNDSVIGRLYDKFKDKNVAIVYFPDHGEEIYDVDDYMGHGNVHTRKHEDMKYQLEIPLVFIMTDSFKINHPDLANKISVSKNRRAFQSDIANAICEIGGIESKHIDPTRSVINEAYDSTFIRIVANSIPYDK